jgi:hypothetical protein
METDIRDDDDDEADLTEFEAGFLMGYFEAKGIEGDPSIEQFTEAVEALAAARGRRDGEPFQGVN